MFVKTTVRKRGDKTYTYLSLVESVRVEGKMVHNTLLRLGEVSELRESGQLDRIIGALRAHAEKTWVSVDDAEAQAAPGYGAIAAALTYFDRLQLGEFFAGVGARRGAEHLEDTVFVMLANRLIRPWSKRRTILSWLDRDVVVPDGVSAPSLDQCYRAIDALAEAKESLEPHLYNRLTDLTNLDLRLALYDVTSTYWESRAVGSARFPSRAFGYSRDHRSDRPQVVIGLLVTGDGIPIAHHVFSGNTSDVTTLPSVMADYQARFGVGRIALVADRGLISEDNVSHVAAAGFDHVLATKLHNDDQVETVLTRASVADLTWVEIEDLHCRAAEINEGGRRFVVVHSPAREVRDDARHDELMARAEEKLIALAERVRAGRLADPAKIGAAADRILRDSGVGRCFHTTIRDGFFHWDYDQHAYRYDTELLAGRYVIATSLNAEQASVADVVRFYRGLQHVERRFKVMKDFLGLRPVHHFTEARVRGHIALCVLAAVIEAVMAKELAARAVMDPDLTDQVITPRRALAELDRIRQVSLEVSGRSIKVITKRNALQAQVLAALGVNTASWDKADIA
ncbi:MAG TPA: IS1634 family transposase [Solirubrobacteraceae bacterium]|nr:IS1634 family transposase [Solirubrobacteraceae bacterium]